MKLKIDPDIKMTPAEFTRTLNELKPHIVKIEEEVLKLDYGTMDIRIEVRAGEVVKMEFWKGERWLKVPTDRS